MFHLGILERLATQGLLEEVHCLSTVSGGSLAAGLVLTLGELRWPDSATYRSQIVPAARRLLTELDLQNAYLRRCCRPWLLVRGRAWALACALEELWGIRADLAELPEHPRWLINATTYETGKNWRFEHRQMGDWKANYVLAPRFPLARAIAASAAVPGVIGPLVLRGRDYQWHEKRWATRETLPVPPKLQRISLWDGGVYENLGIEGLFKPDRGYLSNVDFLLVSDATAPLSLHPPRYKAPYRLVEVAMDQVHALRARMIVGYFDAHRGTGSLLRLGNTAEYIFSDAGVEPPPQWDPGAAMPAADVRWIRGFGTHLHRLSGREFEGLFHHGYEIADITLAAYCGDRFDHVPYVPPAPERAVPQAA